MSSYIFRVVEWMDIYAGRRIVNAWRGVVFTVRYKSYEEVEVRERRPGYWGSSTFMMRLIYNQTHQ